MKVCICSSSYNDSSGNYLGSYLAGLIEGDGSIIVPKTLRNQKVKITFVKKDAPLAHKIMEVIKGGTIVYPKDSNYLDLLFQDMKSIQNIAVLLNGSMRTPKIEALHRLIDRLNARFTSGLKISKLSLDSNGNFYSGFNLNSEKIAQTIKCYMRVSQKQSHKSTTTQNNSNFYIMDKIRDFLDVKNVIEIQRNKKNYVELAYEVHHIRISKLYKSLGGTSRIISLKNSMNTKRTQFN
ncbi:hypothetical protein K503DRAFT_794809 [Rhizopogon vinicolor AM-OR11-026]|uniref:Homing endonuclease LAGLIDADG domain-containing protein n=1 Tax=Rhizopogon vinicolor AM-OR11-026 TaxID=1314800 RepID=A0A1B7MHZ0_9AGAM|nr:hypothetical protein K503DRAFT_794809 [Rhizopogon vinicolor AM-OR11-026]